MFITVHFHTELSSLEEFRKELKKRLDYHTYLDADDDLVILEVKEYGYKDYLSKSSEDWDGNI